MPLVHLGKLLLRWCPHCDLPVLDSKQCGRCRQDTVAVEITPPGDVRPAFPRDVELIKEVVDRQFGTGTGKALIPEGRIVLLNKVPALDRMEEIIIGGEACASLRFDLDDGWVFLTRMPAARAVQGSITKGFVIADEGAIKPIIQSSNLLAPGIIDMDPEIQVGDKVIILDRGRRAFATGMARMSASEIQTNKRGLAVKVRWAELPRENVQTTEKRSWDDVVRANRPELDKRVAEASAFIRKVIESNALPAMVSFSGGKDSLATLILTLKAGYRLPVFFIDTGLEFPETVEHVKDIAKKHGLELIVENAPREAFQEGLKVFGPPGRDYRWCCKTNKLGPTVRAIMQHFPGGVLSFIGQRRYESEMRSSKPRVWRNPWTPGQVGASPIQNWTALHVWLLIFSEGESYNPWYERGLDRIGCYLCPASDLAELRFVEESSESFKEWGAYLKGYARANGLPEAWVSYGAWRWRSLPSSISQELGRIKVSVRAEKGAAPTEEAKQGNLRLHMQKGVSPCTLGYSIEGAFSRPLHLKRVANALNILGEVKLNDEEGWCAVNDVTVFDAGALMARGKDPDQLREKVEKVRRAVVKAEECVGCGVCVARCLEGALGLELGRIQIENGKCAHCGRCLEPCPAITFGDTAFEF